MWFHLLNIFRIAWFRHQLEVATEQGHARPYYICCRNDFGFSLVLRYTIVALQCLLRRAKSVVLSPSFEWGIQGSFYRRCSRSIFRGFSNGELYSIRESFTNRLEQEEKATRLIPRLFCASRYTVPDAYSKHITHNSGKYRWSLNDVRWRVPVSKSAITSWAQNVLRVQAD